jgi:extracellular matrix regulatory protein A
MSSRLLNVGYGNVVAAGRIVAVVSPDSAPMKRLKDDARERGKLVDATQGRRTRAIVVTDTDHVILSALSAETLTERLETGKTGKAE